MDNVDEIQLRRLTKIDHPDPLPAKLVELYKQWKFRWDRSGGGTPCDLQVLCLMVAVVDLKDQQPKASDRMARARAAKRAKAAPRLQTELAPELANA